MAIPPSSRSADRWKNFLLSRSQPDNQTPIPPQTGGMTPWLPPFQLYPSMSNVGVTLPPYEQPGGSLPMDRYMNQRPAPVVAPQPQIAAPPQQPAQSGGQGWGGPEPAPGTIPPEYDPMQDPRYLPEQWRGAFTNWLYPQKAR